jgi:hypothetical protein
MGRDSKVPSQNWNTGSNSSPPAAVAVETARFQRWLFYVLNPSAPSIFSTANVEAQQKDGARFSPAKEGVFTSGPMTVSNLMERKDPLKKVISSLATGPWIKPRPGPIISSAGTTMRRVPPPRVKEIIIFRFDP